ncbi:hypothetical protein M404DRAFT_999798 [Pisolithus tinctorius Marx 270]|uniref:Uncharacterized protein n=1 Tax=Pisolithus tinctorius Marx 270 TaxID=870435 RepID=A0A0C3K7Y4_PISTI|nr:hypothetical protein M404DRAFT_999798 [Pisolithus tinctorius Marx 270]
MLQSLIRTDQEGVVINGCDRDFVIPCPSDAIWDLGKCRRQFFLRYDAGHVVTQ